eukprot:3934109-Rhodomonas_salina.1
MKLCAHLEVNKAEDFMRLVEDALREPSANTNLTWNTTMQVGSNAPRTSENFYRTPPLVIAVASNQNMQETANSDRQACLYQTCRVIRSGPNVNPNTPICQHAEMARSLFGKQIFGRALFLAFAITNGQVAPFANDTGVELFLNTTLQLVEDAAATVAKDNLARKRSVALSHGKALSLYTTVQTTLTHPFEPPILPTQSTFHAKLNQFKDLENVCRGAAYNDTAHTEDQIILLKDISVAIQRMSMAPLPPISVPFLWTDYIDQVSDPMPHVFIERIAKKMVGFPRLDERAAISILLPASHVHVELGAPSLAKLRHWVNTNKRCILQADTPAAYTGGMHALRRNVIAVQLAEAEGECILDAVTEMLQSYSADITDMQNDMAIRADASAAIIAAMLTTRPIPRLPAYHGINFNKVVDAKKLFSSIIADDANETDVFFSNRDKAPPSLLMIEKDDRAAPAANGKTKYVLWASLNALIYYTSLLP